MSWISAARRADGGNPMKPFQRRNPAAGLRVSDCILGAALPILLEREERGEEVREEDREEVGGR